MKKHFLLAVMTSLIFTGCVKKQEGCSPVSPQAEEEQIKSYIAANGINATKDISGIYYQVVDSGSGARPNLNTNIYITYTGKFLNGTVFDQVNNADSTGWKLGSLIEGWGIGMQFIKKGGKIKLIIPSSLAYSCTGAGNAIPPNSVLYFDITLVDVGCRQASVATEEAQIKAFATSKGINATKDSSGLYYQIIDTGSGNKPALTSKVFVTYTGTFLNGSQFDQATNSAATGWILNSLIEGWKIGLPLIKKGGRIKLIIPSSLAYGCTGAGTIPPNTILYFDVTLVNIE